MALLPIPCYKPIKLQPRSNPCPIPRLFSNIHQSQHIPFISSTMKTSYESKSLDRVMNNNTFLQLPHSSSSSSSSSRLRQGQLLANKMLETKQNDETLEREVEIVMCRLRGVVEKFMEVEIQKINGRLKGTSEEDKLLVEKMSREIADKFLKRPIEYLKASCNEDFESRLNDLNFLIRMLQKSCSGCQR